MSEDITEVDFINMKILISVVKLIKRGKQMDNKKNIKDMNIWSYFKKLTPKQEAETDGTVLNDGFGNAYLVPDVGRTDLYSLDDDSFLYCYNFKDRELEAYAKDSDSSYEYIDSISLNVGDFADSPTYWVRVYATKLQDFGYQEAEQIYKDYVSCVNEDTNKEEYSEALNSSDSYSTMDTYRHRLIYKLPNINLNLPDDDSDWDNNLRIKNEYKKYIESLNKSYSYNNDPVVRVKYSDKDNCIYIEFYFINDEHRARESELWDLIDELLEKIKNPVGSEDLEKLFVSTGYVDLIRED